MADMYDEIKVGDVWKRKRDGVLVTVKKVERIGLSDVDVQWERTNPRRRAWCWGSNWLGLYERVQSPGQSTEARSSP